MPGLSVFVVALYPLQGVELEIPGYVNHLHHLNRREMLAAVSSLT